mmetsp:Transcript_11820/g.16511  ORF Transcript_11820/g.16511 Transcript_11820/m.16511 type:complete len:604 (+) Transcript_11820:185-1996(+)
MGNLSPGLVRKRSCAELAERQGLVQGANGAPHHEAKGYYTFPGLRDSDKQGGCQLQDRSVVREAWFGDGIFQAPRLRCDWDSLNKGDDRKYVSLNAFFDTLYSVIITSLGLQVRQQQDMDILHHWIQYYGIVLSLWLASAEYSSRFDNDDVTHKIFWSLYGVGLLGIMMHVEDGPQVPMNSVVFMIFLGWTYFLLALSWFRCAWSLPRCRFHCTTYGCVMVLHMIVALAAAKTRAYPWIRGAMFYYLALAYHLGACILITSQIIGARVLYPNLSFAEARKILDLPLHIQFHIDRFSTLMLMVLGQVAKAVVWRPSQIFGDSEGLYVACGFAFVLLVCMKIFLFDCDYLDAQDHAIRRSQAKGLTWLLIFPVNMGCVTLMGIGAALLVAETGKINAVRAVQHHWAQWLTCTTFALFLVLNILARNLHHVPYVRVLRDHGEISRAEMVVNIFYIQCAIQAASSGFVLLLPYMGISSLGILQILTIILIFLIVLNLMDEMLLLRTVEEVSHNNSQREDPHKSLSAVTNGTASFRNNNSNNNLTPATEIEMPRDGSWRLKSSSRNGSSKGSGEDTTPDKDGGPRLRWFSNLFTNESDRDESDAASAN